MAFEIYKKGQGFYTRMGTAVGAGLLLAWFFVSLSDKLEGFVVNDPGKKAALVYGLPTVIMAVLAWLIYWLLNKPSIADFMIVTEGEMKKVSWSSRKEIIASTKIVIVVVIILALLLAAVDLLFMRFFQAVDVLRI